MAAYRRPASEERALELAVDPVERPVLPVEAAAGLGGRDEQRQQDRAERAARSALGPPACAAREDRRGRLAAQLVERDPRVLGPARRTPATRRGRAAAVGTRKAPSCSSTTNGISPCSRSGPSGEGGQAERAQGLDRCGARPSSRLFSRGRDHLRRDRSGQHPDRAAVSVAATPISAGSRGTSTRSGCRRPGRGRGSLAAPRARPADQPVDAVPARRPSSESRISRAAASRARPELARRRLCERPPGRELRLPERLRLPLVADPGDEPLVEDRIADGTALVAAAELRDHVGRDPRRPLEDVWAEPRMPRACSSSTGPFHWRPSSARAAEHEPRPSAQLGAPGDERPAPVHPQVARRT